MPMNAKTQPQNYAQNYIEGLLQKYGPLNEYNIITHVNDWTIKNGREEFEKAVKNGTIVKTTRNKWKLAKSD